VSEDPARLTIEDGRLVAAERGAGPELLAQLSAHGELGTNLAELGVGTNDAATLSGNVLEDEKILGTVHVAFGASTGIGGTVSVPIHLDVVVLEASLEIDGRPVLDAGRFVL
jgi:leucyl aminopeptidase (aminopeptidase T)